MRNVIITRDGARIPGEKPKTPNEAFEFLLRYQGQSVDYAIKHGDFNFVTLDPIKAKLCDLPDLYDTEDLMGDCPAVKLFLPEGAATWVVWEYSWQSNLGFGWVDLGFGPGCAELGYISVGEIMELRTQVLRLPVEIDQHVHTRFKAIESAGGEVPSFLQETVTSSPDR